MTKAVAAWSDDDDYEEDDGDGNDDDDDGTYDDDDDDNDNDYDADNEWRSEGRGVICWLPLFFPENIFKVSGEYRKVVCI